MNNREKIYDDLISPLLTQVVDIARSNGIQFFMTFDITSPEDIKAGGDLRHLSTSCHLDSDLGPLPVGIAACHDIIIGSQDGFALGLNGKLICAILQGEAKLLGVGKIEGLSEGEDVPAQPQ